MSRQDANAAFARTSFLYGGNAAYVEQLHSRYEADPASVDAEWRAFFESLKDDRADVIKNASGPSWQRPNIPHANGELIAALTGDWSEVEKTVGDKIKAKAQAKGVEISAAEVQQADARFDPRADADPRLPRPRPFPRQARSARPRAARRTKRSSIRAPTASPKPISTARSSSTRCSAWNSRPCARSSRSCAAPTARRSASSSCTSPMRRRRPGFRSASRAATRRSPSPARASARSSTSWSRPRASRSSAT